MSVAISHPPRIDDLFADAAHLLEELPLPAALAAADGRVLWRNHRFRDLFPGNSGFPAARLLEDLGSRDGVVETELDVEGPGPTPFRVHGLQSGSLRLLVLDDTPQSSDAKVRQLNARIERLERDSLVDPLTGAWNRRYLDTSFAAEIRRSRRHRLPLSAALIDIDHFKDVNDRHGHLCGDAVLRELVRVLRGEMRESDLIVRWGGEEFTVVMPSTAHAAAAALAGRLRARVAGHVFPVVGRLTVSIGVAEHDGVEPPEAMFARMDQALYRAKAGGRNRVEAVAGGASEAWAREDAGCIVKLTWHESYRCEDPTIDTEHRELFERANALIAASLRSETTQAELLSAMDHCFAHVAEHFEHEEAILAQRRFAGLEAHRLAHRVLLARASALRKRAQLEESVVGELVEFFAHEVVANHILTSDRAYYPLFAAVAES